MASIAAPRVVAELRPHDIGAALANAREMAKATPTELAELERQKKLEGAGDATDPGPNAEISRESPSGKPADTTKTRREPRAPEDV